MRSHISPEGPGKCNAATVEACPFNDPDGAENHFDSLNDAKAEYERRMSNRLFAPLKKSAFNVKFTENKSVLANLHYEAKVKAVGQINPEELTKNSWKSFGFAGPNLLKMKASIEELTFYNQASTFELAKLSEEEKASLKYFTSSKFVVFNRTLFGNRTINEDEKEFYTTLVSKIDESFMKNPSFNRVTYRGVKTRSQVFGIEPGDDYYTKEAKINGYVDKNFRIGKTVEFAGYQSTSLDPKVATDWADKDGLVFEIMSPNGLNITSISNNVEETEVLMPRNTKYIVVGVQTSKEMGFSYRSKPSHIIQLVAVDDDNNISQDGIKHQPGTLNFNNS